jgi:hypothetical protein
MFWTQAMKRLAKLPVITGDLMDFDVYEFGKKVDVLTFEIELC